MKISFEKKIICEKKWICRIFIFSAQTSETCNQLSMWSFYINIFQIHKSIFIYLCQLKHLVLFLIFFHFLCDFPGDTSPFNKLCFLNSFFFFSVASSFYLHFISLLEMLPGSTRKEKCVYLWGGEREAQRGRLLRGKMRTRVNASLVGF